MRPKVVALIAASSVSVGWLLASLIVPPVAELQVLPERSERRRPAPSTPATTTYTEQLHLRLQQAPQAPVTRRNPFIFGSRSAPSTAVATTPKRESNASEPDVEAVPIPAPAGPSLRLSGVGSTGGVRTAVIADGTTVHLVKVGETVNGYSVVEITDDAVTIEDASGAQWKLRMR
jgi:Tfp pilus assembly protein PilP